MEKIDEIAEYISKGFVIERFERDIYLRPGIKTGRIILKKDDQRKIIELKGDKELIEGERYVKSWEIAKRKQKKEP